MTSSKFFSGQRGSMASEYGVSLKELRDLMEYRGSEGREKILGDYGNVQELCRRLKTSTTQGLTDPQDITRRREVFGPNVIPSNRPKTGTQIEDGYKYTVLRNGAQTQLDAGELVVGDICMIQQADVLPADGVLIESKDLKIDESSLSGEVELIKKGLDVDPMMLSGSRATEGTGKMVVTAAGLNAQKDIPI